MFALNLFVADVGVHDGLYAAERGNCVHDRGCDGRIIAVVVSSIEHTGKIDDEIISQIRKSRFLVADFTGHRGGVYFEAGFAMGLGLPVFWTCRRDQMKELHFDIRQYNCIDWNTLDELAERLQRRVEAVIGKGPNLPLR